MKVEERNLIAAINAAYEGLKEKSNDELRQEVMIITSCIACATQKTEALDSFIVPIFAIVKETARRFTQGDIVVTANEQDRWLSQDKSNDFVTIEGGNAVYHNSWNVGGSKQQWNMIHYDEQLLGGYYLHKGYAVEMATGEGKTLVATLPVFLNALSHQGVHVMTVNEYLSYRDFQQTRPIYALYGLTAGCIEYQSNNTKLGKKRAYKSDIVFGTIRNFTFDYLFDNIASTLKDCVQQNHHFAIIDELDSILIDESQTPHIISGGFCIDNSKLFKKCNQYISELCELANKDEHKQRGPILETIFYISNKYNHTVTLTDAGMKWLSERLSNEQLFLHERLFEIPNLHQLTPEEVSCWKDTLKVRNALMMCLEAHTVYHKDVDYIISDNKIIIVDKNTGRLKPTSRWEHGLHTAVEVKEGMKVKSDLNSMAVISLKNYLKLYDKICGMSGTISEVSQELLDTYSLKSVSIPTHKPVIRKDEPLRAFLTKQEKDIAIIDKILTLHNQGRPILVGAPSIERAHEIASLLNEREVTHRILDATTLKNEAYVISIAGQERAITVSTSIAGRGTDIKLIKETKENGGLAVIATDMFESLRVEQQLCGRAGRQGDPGSSVTFVSLEDDIISELDSNDFNYLSSLLNTGTEQDEIIRLFRKAQQTREQNAYKARQKSNRKDDIVAPFRRLFYTQRRAILEGSIHPQSLLNLNALGEAEDNIIKRNLQIGVAHIESIVRRIHGILPTIVKWNIPIPCVFKEKTFVFYVPVGANVEKKNTKQIKNDLIKRIYLLYADTYWMEFVEHISEKLTDEEISILPSEIEKVHEQIKTETLKCLSGMKVIINEKDVITPQAKRQTCFSPNIITSVIIPANDTLCPCGSGKPFSECHGVSKRKIRRR